MQPWQDSEIDAIRHRYREFARAALRGDPTERDRRGGFSRDDWQKVAAFGLLGLCMPERYGGAGRPVTHALAAFEGLGEALRDSGFLYALCSQLFGIQMPMNLLGSDELKERYLPRLIAGEIQAVYAFTEEAAGSDAFSMQARARKVEGGYRLDAVKRYLTNAPNADIALVFARTSEKRSPFGLIAVVVEMSAAGARHGAELEKVGLRTVPMGELFFENVLVPERNVIGGPSGGLKVLTESTGWERAVVIGHVLGPMARSLAECRQRALSRQQFGKPIGAFQQVSAKLADMTVTHSVCRTLIYDMASRLGHGQSVAPHLQEAAIVKLFVSERFVELALAALQLFGVRGYLLDSFAQQDVRDSVANTIWGGTSETLRNTIAKLAGLPVE